MQLSCLYQSDWCVFYEAIRAFVNGGNPYTVQLGSEWLRVFEPPWTFMILSPLALFPPDIERYVVTLVGIIVFFISAVKMKANRWQVVMFMLSNTVIGSLYEGNIDWLVTAGLWMPPQLGLFFVMMKPQIGIGVAVYWAYMAWKKGGFAELWYVFAPVLIAYTISFGVYGFWLGNISNMHNNPVNGGLFPWGLVVAIPLLAYAIEHEEQNPAAISSPFFAPYITRYNLSGMLLSMFDRPKIFIFAWIMLWIPTIWRMFLRW